MLGICSQPIVAFSSVPGNIFLPCSHKPSTCGTKKYFHCRKHRRIQSASSRWVSCISYTPFEGNSWCLQINNLRIFVDPWLVGNLQFGPEFLFSGVKKSLKDWKLEDFGNIDLIVLSQGLPDHTHVPTLKRIDKNIPVIASIKAARICHNLGFRHIQVLRHGDSFKFHSVEISAYKGSLVGPPYEAPENGYLFESCHPPFCLYYEPHGNVPRQVLSELQTKSIDVLVVPVVNAAVKWMGFQFNLINEPSNVLQVVKHLQPRQLVPLMNNDLNISGILSYVIASKGSLEEFERSIRASGWRTQVLKPVIGEPCRLLKDESSYRVVGAVVCPSPQEQT